MYIGNQGLMPANYAQDAQCVTSNRQPTMREQLTRQKIELSERLANIEAAISALDENPNFEAVMNIIQKAY